MKIVFFNRFFHPDTSATSQLLSDLAFDLAASGHDVHVVTSHAEGEPGGTEGIHGVTVHRVAAAMTGPHGLAARALAYLRYYRGARAQARRLLGRGDIAVAKTDPPMLSAAVGPIAKARGARAIVWLQDLFPEIAREYGIPGTRGPVGAVLRRMRDRSLAGADAVVVIAENMARRVAAIPHVQPGRVHVVHNWSDGAAIVPVDPAANALRREWGLQDRFVVGYSGNLGRVHEFDTVIEAAAKLRSREDIAFLFIGRGPRLAEVQRKASQRLLANVRFMPHQQRARLGESLGVPDVHLSILRREFEGLVHPSKLYGIMAAGRPTLYVGSPHGDTAKIIAAAHCGVTVETGDADALASRILELHEASEARLLMGANARRAFEALYDRPVAVAAWRRVLGL